MEVPGRKKYCCKYPGCNNWYYTNVSEDFVNKHFFRFPQDPHYHQLWRDVCKADSSQNSKYWTVCEDHFVDCDYVSEKKDRLHFGVVPVSYVEQLGPFEDVSLDNETIEVSCEGNFTCLCNEASSSTDVCSCLEPCLFSHSQIAEVISKSDFDSCIQDHNYSLTADSCVEDHSYSLTADNEVPPNLNKFEFLGNKGKDGILSKIGLSEKELTPTKRVMYKAHRNIQAKLSKLSNMLQKEREKVKILENLYKAGKFEFIDSCLNQVTKEFINSQLRNSDKKPNARRWSEQDKVFALSLYKRSPRLYKYLQAHFQLPSSRTLKGILAKIPFDTGVNPAILEHLKHQVKKMKSADRFCTLIFDEVALKEGFHYEQTKQYICGFEDMGSLGRTNNAANHALVFMVRGIRKQWKQVIAYYFTAHTIAANNLKRLIKEIIGQLQNVGLNVVATVCDQGTTNCSALNQLCAEKHPRQSPYYFFVNEQPIVTIFDVPHLLKNTRNALLKCKIQFDSNDPHKFAKFQYVESVFNFDQQKKFKSLPKLKREHFNFKDSRVKMKVKIAAAQLSSSVASAIETFVTFANVLPSEAIYTAEFIQKIDNLFDSLNSSNPQVSDHKSFRCALSENSPHLEFWSKLLTEMDQWRLIDLNNETDLTNRYSFVKGWQTTIKSIMFLWSSLKNIDGFDYLSLRGLNQDPVENLFSSIRQHGAANTNPTCHQFTAALKTVVVNKLVSPTNVESNCEVDACTPLDDLAGLMKCADFQDVEEQESQSELSINFETPDLDDLPVEDTQGLAYVAGWVLKNIDCGACQSILYSDEVTHRHLLTSFRERDNVQRLTYASDRVMAIVDKIHTCLYEFLNNYGFQRNLEKSFKNEFRQSVDFGQRHCMEHDCENLILDKCVTFLIFKFCRDKHKQKTVISDAHKRRMKRLKTQL